MSRSKAEVAKAKDRARKRAARAARTDLVEIATDCEIPTVRLLERVSEDLGISIGQVVTEMVGDDLSAPDRWHIDAEDHPTTSIAFTVPPEISEYLRSEPRYRICGMLELLVLRRCRVVQGRIEYIHPVGNRVWPTSTHLVDRSEAPKGWDKYKNRREIRIRHSGTWEGYVTSEREAISAENFALEQYRAGEEAEADMHRMTSRVGHRRPRRDEGDVSGIREAEAKAKARFEAEAKAAKEAAKAALPPIAYIDVPAPHPSGWVDPEIEETRLRREAEAAKTQEALNDLTDWIRKRDAEQRRIDREEMAAAAAARAARAPEPVPAVEVEVEVEDPAARVHRLATAEALAAMATRAGEPGPRVPWRSPHAWKEAPVDDGGEVW